MAGSSILYFGRLAREKGLHTLIRAAADAKCKLEIVGTGPELESLKSHASQTGAEVRFLGYLSGTELHETIRNARAVVLPSEWYENAPMSILEAYALGKPVIGAQIGGIPELIRGGDTGFLYASGDSTALANTLRRICSMSDSDVADMGRRGRHWVDSDFTPGAYTNRVLAAYRELGVAL